MNYMASKKVVGGKFLRVKIEADTTITKMQILGDFFLHPEESLPAIEKSLIGLHVNSTSETFASHIQQALTQQNAAFIGLTPEDIAQTMVEAISASEK